MRHLGRRALVAAAIAMAAAAAAPAAEEEVAVVATPFGEIAWRFLPEAAPAHVAYVKELIGRGFYDGTTFHRVLPRFVVQGGDPNSKNDTRADDGDGEADRRLAAEFSETLHYRPGTIGMARDTAPDSGSCQFFIALEELPRLDGKYTIFGELVAGLEVARKIAEVPRDLNDNPLERIPIQVRLVRRAVPETVLSRTPGDGSGELLTGPDKPKLLDPADPKWTAPRPAGALAAAGPAGVRLDLALDAEGRVIDVRFADPATTNAAAIAGKARGWSFTPARYAGVPQKVRIGIDATGTNLGAPPLPPSSK